VREVDIDALDAQHLDQKLTQLEDPTRRPCQLPPQQVGMPAQGRGATSRRANDMVVFNKRRLEALRQRPGGGDRAGVDQGLPAARLLRWHLDPHPMCLQELERGHPHVGIELVDVTRDEQGNPRIGVIDTHQPSIMPWNSSGKPCCAQRSYSSGQGIQIPATGMPLSPFLRFPGHRF
jgi:hypothetical protein